MNRDEKIQDLMLDTFAELQRSEAAITATIKNHPKRRGELRAEYERRILRLAREGR